MQYKYVAFDLDGTLLDSTKNIRVKNFKMIRRIQKIGVEVILASGRPPAGIESLAEALELHIYGGYLLGYNGGEVIDCTNGKTVFSYSMKPDDAKKAIRAAKKFGLTPITYKDSCILTEDDEEQYVRYEAKINGIEIRKVNNLEENLPDKVVKILAVASEDIVSKNFDALKAELGDGYDVTCSTPFFVEIMPKGINKATSLEKLMIINGFTSENLVAFGDGGNDRSMIDYSGIGVAMGNAVDSVKDSAKFVVEPNDKDGISVAIRHIWANELSENKQSQKVDMIKEERCRRIVEYVDSHKYASINKLMEVVNASKSTIRRDLIELKEGGKLDFVRGGAASLKSSMEAESLYTEKTTHCIDEKEKIGKAAAQLIHDNDVIFIGAGTTTKKIIKHIDAEKSINVITNDIIIASELTDFKNVSVNLTGGQLRRHYFTLTGNFAEEMIDKMNIEKCFISCDAMDFDKGCYIANTDEIGINRKTIESSSEIIVLCDHTKLNSRSFVAFCEPNQIDILITDQPLKKDESDKCEQAGIKVIIV